MLVSGGVVIVISVKLYDEICGCSACGCAYPAGKFSCADILRLEQKVALCAANKIGRLLLAVRNVHFPHLLPEIAWRSAYSNLER